MEKTSKLKNVSFIIIAVGVVLFSVAFFFAAGNFSRQGSYVEVKGSAERIVKADVAIWTIGFSANSNSADDLYSQIENNLKMIKDFLLEKGFEESEINVAPINIYQDTYKEARFLYNSHIDLSVYSNKVDLVRSTSQDTLPLIKKGITMGSNYIEFEFSDINSIKPEMLAESLENAKNTADQIASETGSLVSKISRGNQGVFSITQKDPGSPEYKKVRVVSTLRFLIK
jgi:hypothetical protein